MIKREMIKAFSGLEGIELIRHKNVYARKLSTGDLSINGVQYSIYDPIEDLALTFKAMVKYDVCINGLDVTISHEEDTYQAGNLGFLSVPDYGLIAYSIIECILKSEGEWID